MSELYTQRFPALELEIGRATPDVPNDGMYYLLSKGMVVGRFRSLQKAQEAYKRCIEQSGWEPPSKPELTAEQMVRREDIMRDRDRTAAYWGEADSFRRRGKLRHR